MEVARVLVLLGSSMEDKNWVFIAIFVRYQFRHHIDVERRNGLGFIEKGRREVSVDGELWGLV
jgi:hypothetical protein